MTDLLRTFVAVKIEPSQVLIQTIKDLKNKLSGEPVRWVEPDKLHLTLKFLGNTFPSQVDEIGEELNQVSKMFSFFSFQLEGLGFFKNKGMPRVLFANIQEGEVLQHQAAEIDIRLATLGFQPETRQFKPHLTLARIKFLKNRRAFYQAVENYRHTFMQTSKIDEIIFYLSILNPEGPEYIPLNVLKL